MLQISHRPDYQTRQSTNICSISTKRASSCRQCELPKTWDSMSALKSVYSGKKLCNLLCGRHLKTKLLTFATFRPFIGRQQRVLLRMLNGQEIW